MDIRRVLITAGILLIAIGLLWPLLRRIGLGRLPGDLVMHRPGLDLYFPIVTCLIVSIVLSLVLWLLRR